MLLLGWLIGCNGPDKPVESGTDDTGTNPINDADGDGFGADEDCNDANATVYPGAPELWYDGIDQACDGGDDYDADGDGLQGGGGPDCDDTNAAVYPGAIELCDGVDNDCSGAVDDNAVDAVEVYADDDGDGYGAGSPLSTTVCEVGEGTTTLSGDCADDDPTINPAASELCNRVDDNCDGLVDVNAADGQQWVADFDGDGYTDPNSLIVSCSEPASYLPADTTEADCDDSDPNVNPEALESCNGVDDNCDGSIDNDPIDPLVWYQDLDGDNDGDPSSSTTSCDAPAGYVSSAGDCDDSDASRSSQTYEACDGIDNDCDNEVDSDSPDAVLYHPDSDGDGYGDSMTAQSACSQYLDWLTDSSDCDDGNAGISPVATEYCDEVDNDCNGQVDEATAVDVISWYVDADGDLFGSSNQTTLACEAPAGFTDNSDDCDDTEPAANPATRESCDGIDNNCDGVVDSTDAVDAGAWYEDADGDGYGNPDLYSYGCTGPAGSVENGDDCDDGDAAINPAGTESQDLVDEDCDGMVDEDFIGAGDIVVTEIARQPYAGGTGTSLNAQAQWFEVSNTSGFDINLSGWYLEEQDGDRFVVSPEVGVLVPAGGSAVLCYANTWFADPGICAYTWGDASLGNAWSDTTFYFDRDEDLISLYLNGVLMDEVHWVATPEGDGDTWPATAHYSIQLDPSFTSITDNDDAGSWCLADSSNIYSDSGATGHPDYGTPGEPNSLCN
jgi:hypothetical protein